MARPPDFVEFPTKDILQGIHQRFEAQVDLHPENISVKTLENTYTYAQINGYANSLAENILRLTGEKISRAAILLPNTPEIIINMFAALKARKTYVPLDPSFPIERLKVMLEDADPTVLLTDQQNYDLAKRLANSRMRVIDTSCCNRFVDTPNPDVRCDPLDMAYILYTSGSTGRPKGIAFLHRNLLHTTMCLVNQLCFSPSDKVTWLHSASFAASVVDIYCCLTVGATLYPWDVKTQGFTGMASWLVRQHVTSFQWIPSAFRQFLRTVREDFQFPSIRLVVMASEPLTVREVELFRRHFPLGSHLVNQVGTSESYNYRLYAMDHSVGIKSTLVPGGYPVSEDRKVLILDNHLNEVAVGDEGEIGVRSPYMSAGYWRDPELTSRKFVHLEQDSVPVYLTGDLGSLEQDGCLIHLGRKDFQVKLRGFRVELSEIELFLAQAPGVIDAVAWIVNNNIGENQLVAYIIPDQTVGFDQRQVKEFMETHLPDYMVPRYYRVLDSFPVLPTGKVNRRALPNPFDNMDTGVEQKIKFGKETKKTTSLQQSIMMLFRELLQIEDIYPDSDFFSLGGDSLLAALLIYRIYSDFGVEIDIDSFSASPTPQQLIDLIGDRKAVKKGIL